ncbi:hypothetical protein AB0425_41380 [Actinosynnema sp. NPDC051121]
MKSPAVMAAAVLLAALGGCGVFGGKHEVGECVRTRETPGGTDIVTVGCPTKSHFTLGSLTDPIYRIDQVLDFGTHCPIGKSFGGIELQHEPDDAVYCLELTGT